ncbi:MAG: glycosyltransferase family 9 protein [Nevskia sp.]|nr:glycosyltransferase family 9 protein [Nevskia sp.]
MIAEPHQLGDVLLTFPMAGAVKRRWPHSRVYLAALPFTRPLIEASSFVDGFLDCREVVREPAILRRIGADIFLNPFPDIDLAKAARRAGVPVRVGNLKRLRGAVHCNRFMMQTDAGGTCHTIDRNLGYLRPLGFPRGLRLSSSEALYGLRLRVALEPRFGELIDPSRFNLLLHLKSGGHGHEWPLGHFLQLTQMLAAHPAKLFLTGTAAEREQVQRECPALLARDNVTDLMGRLDLDQFLAFVQAADGMIASSTGPIHIAAALGRRAFGIYPCGTAIDPARWAPRGTYAESITAGWRCEPGRGNCPGGKGPPCPCTIAVTPREVMGRLLAWLDARRSSAPDGSRVRPQAASAA